MDQNWTEHSAWLNFNQINFLTLFFDTFTIGQNPLKMRRYLIIYERSADGYSAYIPDLPGCTSAGATRQEVEENIVEAINVHIEVMRKSGLDIPEAISESEMLVIP